ncbi:hypothetical protein [Micromonospora sp. CB01531]|uniref:hypothetical protein n=1 Tax=Micromonospora sp. CB01531 TaxID=1718947 RepID=UPI00093C5785|nr:hypothetical protein [Micromonospora sp. CB01531]
MPEGRAGAARLVRGVPDSRRPHPRPAAPAGLVVAQVAADLPLRSRSALPRPAPHSHQPRPLARRGGAVKADQEQAILAEHVRGIDGMCVGCRAWWSRLTPYPCWQVDWATSRQARTITTRFLGGVR